MTPLTTPAQTCPPAQADRISVVAAVVDAIAAGCVTADSIADAIDMSGRQGAYYPNAAWRLGYAEPDHSTSPVTWLLTTDGEHLVAADPAQRVALLTDALLGLDDLEVYLVADGANTLSEQWSQAGYSPETISRRLQTVAAWAEFLIAEPEVQAAAVSLASQTTLARAPEARQRAEAHAVEHARPKRQSELVGAVCDGCFMTKPLTGACPNCA